MALTLDDLDWHRSGLDIFFVVLGVVIVIAIFHGGILSTLWHRVFGITDAMQAQSDTSAARGMLASGDTASLDITGTGPLAVTGPMASSKTGPQDLRGAIFGD
jgi:hypothetical protein